MREIITKIKKPALVAKRRDQIMKAAMALFRKNGYHGTTMRQICEKSKVNRGSFYDYFGGKEDILVYIYKQMMYPEGNSDRAFRKVNISGWDDLEPYIRAVLSVSWNRHKHRIQLLYRETISLDKRTLQEVIGIESDYIKSVADNLRKGLGLPAVTQGLEIMANTMVYINSFIPLRGWNMLDLDQDKILDFVTEMLMLKLKDMRSPVRAG
jgi:TetR/AcrR family transcriptional regulator, cholesterol catabolism regulator